MPIDGGGSSNGGAANETRIRCGISETDGNLSSN